MGGVIYICRSRPVIARFPNSNWTIKDYIYFLLFVGLGFFSFLVDKEPNLKDNS
jgi:hypothetical protein